jgi:hypothetical protein
MVVDYGLWKTDAGAVVPPTPKAREIYGLTIAKGCALEIPR